VLGIAKSVPRFKNTSRLIHDVHTYVKVANGIDAGTVPLNVLLLKSKCLSGIATARRQAAVKRRAAGEVRGAMPATAALKAPGTYNSRLNALRLEGRVPTRWLLDNETLLQEISVQASRG
jgi:hypothetical protein